MIHPATNITLPSVPFALDTARDDTRPYDRRASLVTTSSDRPMPQGAARVALVKYWLKSAGPTTDTVAISRGGM